MRRAWWSVFVLTAVCGCSHFQQQTDPCACDDCLPPPVAGTHFYHKHLDNILTTCTAQSCAKRDLKQFDTECGPLSCDYKHGYTQAFIDLAAGRPACVPAVPPRKYWHAWHRSCAGQQNVEDWYAGYRHGLDNGLNSGVSRFNRVVPNAESCCVSAAYVSPYATPESLGYVQPLGNQTISRNEPDDGNHEFVADAPVGDDEAAEPWAPADYVTPTGMNPAAASDFVFP